MRPLALSAAVLPAILLTACASTASQLPAQQQAKRPHSEIVRSFVDGDHLIPHLHAVREPGTRGNAIVAIFELENGKMVEHWDVTQAIPEKTASANPMF